MKVGQFKRPKDSTREAWVVSIMESVSYDLKRLKNAMSLKISQPGVKL